MPGIYSGQCSRHEYLQFQTSSMPTRGECVAMIFLTASGFIKPLADAKGNTYERCKKGREASTQPGLPFCWRQLVWPWSSTSKRVSVGDSKGLEKHQRQHGITLKPEPRDQIRGPEPTQR